MLGRCWDAPNLALIAAISASDRGCIPEAVKGTRMASIGVLILDNSFITLSRHGGYGSSLSCIWIQGRSGSDDSGRATACGLSRFSRLLHPVDDRIP